MGDSELYIRRTVAELIPGLIPTGTVLPEAGSQAAGSLPPLTMTPIISPPLSADDVLNEEQALALIKEIVGKDEEGRDIGIPENYFTFLKQSINKIVNNDESSSEITRLTRAEIDRDRLLKDSLHFYLCQIIYNTSLPSPGLAEADFEHNEGLAEESIDLSNHALADGILDARTLEAFQKGALRIRIRSYTNRENKIEKFCVVLQCGSYGKVIAEYKDGKITIGDPPLSPLAQGVIAYLQRLLLGNGANKFTLQKGEGIFCLNTFKVLQSFLSRKNLMATSFNVKETTAIFEQRKKEADEALEKLSVAPDVDMPRLVTALHNYQKLEDAKVRGNQAEISRAKNDFERSAAEIGGNLETPLLTGHKRFTQTKEVLSKILEFIEFASRFQDIQPNNLPEAEQAFIDHCKKAVGKYRTKAMQIFDEIVSKKMLWLDISSLNNKLVKYRKALADQKASPSDITRKNVMESFYGLTGEAYQLMATLRGWQLSSQYDPDLYQYFDKPIKLLTDQYLRPYISAFPEIDRHVNDKLASFDQEFLSKIVGQSRDTSTLQQYRIRYYRARQILEKLRAKAKDDNNPARGLILSFIKETLRKRTMTQMGEVFDAFGRLSRSAGFQMEEMAKNASRNSSLDGYGLQGRELNADISQDLDQWGGFDGLPHKTKSGVYNLAAILYSLMEQYNAYANSEKGREKGVKPLSFAEIIEQAQQVMDELKGLPESEIRQILTILSRTSDSYVIALQELAQELDQRESNLPYRNDRELRGGNEIVITPRAIHELEKGFARTSTLRGIVSLGDLRKSAERQPWLQRHLAQLPSDVTNEDYFFVSILGLYRVPRDQMDQVPKVQRTRLAGSRVSREPIDFHEQEPLAGLKLVMAHYVPISDMDSLIIDSEVTSRLNDEDLTGPDPEKPQGMVRVFGEGKYWIVSPAYVSPLGPSALKIVANSLSNPEISSAVAKFLYSDPKHPIPDKIPELLRRLANGEPEIFLSKDEKELLEAFLGRISNIEEFTALFANLDPDQSRALGYAIKDIQFALSQAPIKEGLSKEDQDILKELARYLSWRKSIPADDIRRDYLYIYSDGREIDDKPSDRLIQTLREIAAGDPDKAFGPKKEEHFRLIYQKSAGIITRVHRDLHLLASKYPAEERGWEGLGIFLKKHYRQMWKHAAETAKPISRSDSLMPGVPQDQNFIINMLIDLQTGGHKLKELAGAHKRLQELEGEIGGSLYASQNDPKLKDEIGKFQDLLGILRGDSDSLRTNLTNLIRKDWSWNKAHNKLAEKGDSSIDENDPVRTYISAFLELLDNDAFTNLNERTDQFLYQVDGLLEMIELRLAQVEIALQTASGRNKRILGIIRTELKNISERIHAIRDERDRAVPKFKEKYDLEIKAQQILNMLSSERLLDREKYLVLKQVFPALLDPDQTGGTVDLVSGALRGEKETVIGPNGDTNLTPAEFLDKFFRENPDAKILLSNLLPAGGQSDDFVTAKTALSQVLQKILYNEQTLNLLTALPVTGTLPGLRNFMGQFLGRLTGGAGLGSGIFGRPFTKTFGPRTLKELMTMANSSGKRLINDLHYWAALSSDQSPPGDLSSQIYMLMAGTKRGQEILRRVLTESGDIPLQRLNRKAMLAFIEFVREEILPHLSNSQLSQTIDRLLEEAAIPLDLREYAQAPDGAAKAADRLDEFAALLPDGDEEFSIFDCDHTDKKNKLLSQFVEAVLTISGKINQTRSQENPDFYAVSYYSSLQTMQDMSLRYQLEDEPEPPHEVTVVHFDEDLKEGEIEDRSLPSDYYHGAVDFIGTYVLGVVSGAAEQIYDDPGGFLKGILKEAAKAIANFGILMGPGIYMGLADTSSDAGDLFRHTHNFVSSFLDAGKMEDLDKAWDDAWAMHRTEILKAIQKLSKNLASSAGAFAAFELFRLFFYISAFGRVKDKDYRGAAGETIGIMTVNGVFKYLRKRARKAAAEKEGISLEDPKPAESESGIMRRIYERGKQKIWEKALETYYDLKSIPFPPLQNYFDIAEFREGFKVEILSRVINRYYGSAGIKVEPDVASLNRFLEGDYYKVWQERWGSRIKVPRGIRKLLREVSSYKGDFSEQTYDQQTNRVKLNRALLALRHGHFCPSTHRGLSHFLLDVSGRKLITFIRRKAAGIYRDYRAEAQKTAGPKPAEAAEADIIREPAAATILGRYNINTGELNGSFRNLTGTELKRFASRLSELGVNSLHVEPGMELGVADLDSIIQKMETTGTAESGRSRIVIIHQNGNSGLSVRHFSVPEGTIVEEAIAGREVAYTFREAKSGGLADRAILSNGELHWHGGHESYARLEARIGKEGARRTLNLRQDLYGGMIGDETAARLENHLSTVDRERFAEGLIKETADPAKRSKLLEFLRSHDFRMHGAGFLVGLATILGVEKLADMLDIRDPAMRFVFVIGLSHTGNVSTMSVIQHGGVSRAIKAIFSSDAQAATKSLGLKLGLVAKSLTHFSIQLGRGLVELRIISQMLEEAGIQNPTINLIASTALHSAGEFALGQMAKRGAETIAGRTAQFAAKLRTAVIQIGLLDMVVGMDWTSYEKSVIDRARQREKQAYGISATALAIPLDAVMGNIVAKMRIGHDPELTEHILEVIREDYNYSVESRRALARILSAGSCEEIISLLSTPVEWSEIDVTQKAQSGPDLGASGAGATDVEVVRISEKEVYDSAISFMTVNQIASIDDPRVYQEIKERFGVTPQQFAAVAQKHLAAFLQAQFAALYHLNPTPIEDLEADKPMPTNNDIRAMFNRDGTLKTGKIDDLLQFIDDPLNPMEMHYDPGMA